MLVFKLLDRVRILSRVGGYCTSYQVAKFAEISVYKARTVLHEMVDAGLVKYTSKEHRPGVYKRIYSLTDKGMAVDQAFFYGVSGGIEK